MAGDWIKMRGALTEHPKVIALARYLHDNREFREWLTPGGSGPVNGQVVSDEALRCVTCALLLRVWSRAREHGEFVGNDLLLPHNCIADLDQLAGVTGFGRAMQKVGWAKTERGQRGVTLPSFVTYNVPLSPAEKQKAYRQRRVTARYQTPVTKTCETLPLEKRREEKKKKKNPLTPLRTRGKKRAVFVPPTLQEVTAYCQVRKNGIDAQAFLDHYDTVGWRYGTGGGKPIKDWQAAVRTWEKRRREEEWADGPPLHFDN